MGLIKFLVIVLGIYAAYWLIVRILLPRFGRYAMKKASERLQDQMKRQAERQQGQERIYQDEDVTIHKTQQTRRTNSASDDEYVDFEEVD